MFMVSSRGFSVSEASSWVGSLVFSFVVSLSEDMFLLQEVDNDLQHSHNTFIAVYFRLLRNNDLVQISDTVFKKHVAMELCVNL